jgi:hypothetical protein
MLSFYAGASDFTRRLVSVKANSKFSSAEAGPEDDGSSQPEDLKAVVAHVKDRWGPAGRYSGDCGSRLLCPETCMPSGCKGGAAAAVDGHGESQHREHKAMLPACPTPSVSLATAVPR